MTPIVLPVDLPGFVRWETAGAVSRTVIYDVSGISGVSVGETDDPYFQWTPSRDDQGLHEVHVQAVSGTEHASTKLPIMVPTYKDVSGSIDARTSIHS